MKLFNEDQSYVQSAAKLFKHLRKFVSKKSYLMQFYEINICQAMIFRLHTVYNKHEMIKIVPTIPNVRIILLSTIRP